MSTPLIIEATYEDGVLKPAHPLPLKEHEKVQVTVEATSSWADRTYGIIGWKGDSETVQRVALDPEFGIEESP